MKTVGIVGSPRIGNTSFLVNMPSLEVDKKGHEILFQYVKDCKGAEGGVL